jgi:PPP family 3-phenylpropionic acid transporter
VPLVTTVADRAAALRETLTVAAIAAPAGFALVGLASGFWPILLTVALASAAFTSTFPLTDAYALKGLARRKRAYGPVRLWGSAAFIVGSFGAGAALDIIAAQNLIWIVVGVFLLAAIATLGLKPVGGEAPRAEQISGAALLRSRAFLTVAAAASLIQASHAVYYGFSALAWTAAGFDGRVIGALWALGVVAEIILFALSARLPPALGPMGLIALGAAGAVLRWAAMAFDPPGYLLPLLQVLHGLSFGATHLGAVQFLASHAPDRLGATAQGYLATLQGLVMAGATALAGVLFAAYSSRAYAAMAAMALAGGLIALTLRPAAATPP